MRYEVGDQVLVRGVIMEDREHTVVLQMTSYSFAVVDKSLIQQNLSETAEQETPTAERPYDVSPAELAKALGRTLMEDEWSQWLKYSQDDDTEYQRSTALPMFIKWRHEIQGPADIMGSDRSDTALEQRLVALERGFAHLGNMHVEAEKRYGRDIPELQRRTQYIAESARVEPRVATLEDVVGRLIRILRKAGK